MKNMYFQQTKKRVENMFRLTQVQWRLMFIDRISPVLYFIENIFGAWTILAVDSTFREKWDAYSVWIR